MALSPLRWIWHCLLLLSIKEFIKKNGLSGRLGVRSITHLVENKQICNYDIKIYFALIP